MKSLFKIETEQLKMTDLEVVLFPRYNWAILNHFDVLLLLQFRDVLRKTFFSSPILHMNNLTNGHFSKHGYEKSFSDESFSMELHHKQ